MTLMGWFTPPFDTANDVRKRLEPYYDILDFHVEGAMLYFRAKKRLYEIYFDRQADVAFHARHMLQSITERMSRMGLSPSP